MGDLHLLCVTLVGVTLVAHFFRCSTSWETLPCSLCATPTALCHTYDCHTFCFHSWAYKLKDLVTLVVRHYDAQPGTAGGRVYQPLYYWVDIFAVSCLAPLLQYYIFCLN